MSKDRPLSIIIRKFFGIFSCIILSIIVIFSLLEDNNSLTIINNNLIYNLLTLIQSFETESELSQILDSFIYNNNKENVLFVYAESDTIQELSYLSNNPIYSFNKTITEKNFVSTNTLSSSSTNSSIINSGKTKIYGPDQLTFLFTPSILSLPSSKQEILKDKYQPEIQPQIQKQQLNKKFTNQYLLKDESRQFDKQRIKNYEIKIIDELHKIDYKLAKQIKENIESEFGSITKLCKIIVNEKLSKDNIKNILNDIVLDTSINHKHTTEIQHVRELQDQYSDNFFNNNHLYSNPVNKYKLSYNNNYTDTKSQNYYYQKDPDSGILINKHKINDDDNNKYNMQYQSDKENKYNYPENVKNSFINNILENMFDGIIYIVWTDNSSGNSDILFSSSIDNGNSFSNPINISNNIGESSNPQISIVEDNIFILWTDNSSGNSDILFSSSIDNGNSFSNPINISNNIGQSTQIQFITD